MLSTVRAIFLPLFVLQLGLINAGAGANVIVRLKGGAEVRGELLKEREEELVIDLGYTVIGIPREQVTESVPAEENGAGQAPAGRLLADDLVSFEPGRKALSVEDNVRRVAEAVVQIQTASGLGSGFIINNLGHLVTNQHVIAGEREIRVVMFRQRPSGLEKVTFDKVRIIAMNGFLDLALLQIEDDSVAGLPHVVLDSSDQLAQGERVFAIGSPLGLERTVSQGIVSVRSRESAGRWYIQTTTQINPGNSGGPLFNLRGEVVGVTNMKIAGVGVEGVGFAIPSGLLQQFLKNREAFAFDPRNANSGFRYLSPPAPSTTAAADAPAENSETADPAGSAASQAPDSGQ
jgi:serine protease Do